MSEISLQEAAERIGRMIREHPDHTERILLNHGARIEAKAAVLTPVDTGFLRRANESSVSRLEAYGADTVTLTIQNRMNYAIWQHDYPHKHHQPQARDHFISIPFEAEIPAIVADIINADIKEANQ